MATTNTTGGLGLVKPTPGTGAPILVSQLNANADATDAGTARVVNVKGAPYNAAGDGTADDRAALVAAETALGAAGGTLFFPAGTYKVGSGLTLLPTTNLLFHGGATLAPATGVVVRLGGTVRAGLHRVFSGAGTVAFDRPQDLYPEWWGAAGDVKTKQTGGAMTSGSAVLATGGDPAFTTADVGKPCVVLGAGAAGVPLVTTVASFTDASHVTLSANAATTVASSRWAVGTDDTAAVQACLNAAAAGSRFVCPVVLTSLYGVSSVRLTAQASVRGHGPVDAVGFYRLAADANPAVSLASGVSGDGVQLRGFTVNAMFVGGTLDGIEVGTAAANLALATGAFVRDVSVRNAAGWAFNLRCNGLHVVNCSSRHDQAPAAANTTAGAFRFIDSLCYAHLIGCTGYYPAGAFWLGAGGGSVYVGVEAETGGTYASADVVTVAASNARLLGVYVTGTGTVRDVVRIPTGFANTWVEGVFVKAGWTMTNLLNDVDRSYVFAGGAPLAGDTAVALYRNRTTWAQADVATSQTTTSTTYTDLTTAGPAVTLSPGTPQDHAVTVTADMANSAAGICLVAPAIAGGAASDTNAASLQGTNQVTAGKRTIATNQPSGATHTAKYRVTSGTGTFSGRRIQAEVMHR